MVDAHEGVQGYQEHVGDTALTWEHPSAVMGRATRHVLTCVDISMSYLHSQACDGAALHDLYPCQLQTLIF